MSAFQPAATPAVPDAAEASAAFTAQVIAAALKPFVALTQSVYWFGLGAAVILIFTVEVIQRTILPFHRLLYSYLFWHGIVHERRSQSSPPHTRRSTPWLWVPVDDSGLTTAKRVAYTRSPASAEAGVSLRSLAQVRSTTPEPVSVVTQRIVAGGTERTVGVDGEKRANLGELRRITEESLRWGTVTDSEAEEE